MAGLNDMPKSAQVLLVVVVCVVLAGLAYYGFIGDLRAQNVKLQADLTSLTAENARIAAYLGPRQAELDRDIAGLQQQIERQKQIVPDQEQADKFMHMVTDQATAAGIAVRRYEAKATVTRDYYVEAPFQMDADGPYYAVLNFFEKLKNMDRIVNVNDLQMASTKNASAGKVKSTYKYSPSESVVASFEAVTFYSHEPSSGAKGGKPGAPAAAAAPAVKK